MVGSPDSCSIPREGKGERRHQKSLRQGIKQAQSPTFVRVLKPQFHAGMELLGEGASSHRPTPLTPHNKQAPCPQTSPILVVSCSSPQDTGRTFSTPPFSQGCQGCQWDLNSVPERRRTPKKGWH